MTSIFAVVEVPLLGMTLDVMIPAHLTVALAISLLVRIINNQTSVALDEKSVVLCDIDNERILNMKTVISTTSLKDACRLAIV